MKKRYSLLIKLLMVFILVPLFAWSFTATAMAQQSKKSKQVQKVSLAKDVYPGINAPWTEPKKVAFKGTIKIGDISDMTGSSSKSCVLVDHGLNDWFRYVNEYLGGVEGYKIELDILDTKSDIQNIINGLNRFIDEGKPIIYSAIAHGVPAAVETSSRRKTPLLCSAGTVSQAYRTIAAAEKEDNYFFSLSPVLSARAEIEVKFFMEDWKKSGKSGTPIFGSFNLDNPLGHESTTGARVYTKKHGASLGVATYCQPAITDARAQVTALKNAKVDYIITGPHSDQAGMVFVLELARQKSADWQPKFCGHTTFATAYMEAKSKAHEGLYIYQYMNTWFDKDVPIVKWMHEINKKWHPEVKSLPTIYTLGTQAGIVMTEALRRGIRKFGDPKNLDGSKMREILETFDKYDPLGLSGPISYNKYDHQGCASLRIAQLKNWTMVPVSGWIEADPYTDEQRDAKYWLKVDK